MGAMPGDPQQCRLSAVRCLALAEQVRKPEARESFLALAEAWKKLAAELESDQMLLKTISELDFSVPSQACEPYEVLASVLKIRDWAA
jgi:hypothetical protein